MAVECPNCGAAVGADARFCPSCGTPLLGPGAERKLATMVFADLVGSTEMATGLDPEEFRARLEPFFEVARRSLAEHGGTLEKYVGDAVLAVFGVPRVHGDDPDRAVAAALALVDRVAELDQGLAVRIGVETGEVLASEGGGDLSVTGEAVNAAARLQQGAAPGEILVGARAARACRSSRLEPHQPIEAKGMPEPLAAWRALATGSPDGHARLPLLGRDDDLELLRLIYRRAVRERAPQLVTITGEAGIGKTRLANQLMTELRSASEPPTILVGRNPPYGRGIAFWALGEILRGAAGAEPEDPVEEVRDRLTVLLSDLGADDAEHLSSSLTVAIGGADGSSDGDAEEGLKRAWRRLVALMAAEQPLVIGVDDAHWADDGLLELIEEVAFGIQDARLFVLCTTRPELYERRPDFGRSARNVSQVELRPLDRDAATELVELLLPDQGEAVAARVARASGGNPFFAEEVARSLSDHGTKAIEHLPDTVHAAITARMDLLPGAEKRTLQYAAILGQGFREEALADLLGRSPRDALAGLERSALVQERVTDGPGTYAFRHQLIRDVAYASLPRRQRANLHERAAAGVRTGHAERKSELAELVAFHLTEAADLEPNSARLDAAREAIVAAADAAIKRGGAARSQELYERASELSTVEEDRVAALRSAGDIALRRWRGDQGLRLFRQAGDVAAAAGRNAEAAGSYGAAVEVAARMGGITGDLTERDLVEILDRARELAPPDDPEIEALLLLDEAWIAWRFQRTKVIGEPATRALALARETGDVRLISSALDAIAADDWNTYRFQDALKHSRERLDLIRATPRAHRSRSSTTTPSTCWSRRCFRPVATARRHSGRRRRASSTSLAASSIRAGRGACFPPSTSAAGTRCWRWRRGCARHGSPRIGRRWP